MKDPVAEIHPSTTNVKATVSTLLTRSSLEFSASIISPNTTIKPGCANPHTIAPMDPRAIMNMSSVVA